MPITRADLDEALQGITTPDGTPLVESGRIGAVVISDARVGFYITVDPAEHDAFQPVRAAAEAAARTLPGIEDVLVALTAETVTPRSAAPSRVPAPSSPSGLAARAKALAGRVRGKPAPDPPPPAGARAAPGAPNAPAGAGAPGRRTRPQGPVAGVARIIAVGAGKGGVGKSTVSVNLALALAQLGWRVGLLDADIYGPSVPRLLGAERHRPQKGGGLAPLEVFGIRAMSIGFLVAPDQSVVWRGPMATGALGQLLRDTAWGALDCLVVDMPPGTGDIQLSLAQSVPINGAVIVTTPQDLALIDVRKAADMFERVHVPIVGVVENMSGFVCPKCGTHSAIFGEGGGAREADARGVPLLGQVPLTMAIREASDAGTPLAAAQTPEAKPYFDLASSVMGALATRQDKPFPKIIFEDA